MTYTLRPYQEKAAAGRTKAETGAMPPSRRHAAPDEAERMEPMSPRAHESTKRLALALLFALALPVAAGGPTLMRASWYGEHHQGRLTASGERFDRWGFTCAHRTLKHGTWLHLVDPKTHRWVDVRVTDRGPYVAGRDLDLSEQAARQLRIEERGVALLEVTVMGEKP